ncbi:hypothetical protein L596_001247 [Steinernema carpocapsae]|uniref:Uncharacterized protein n=1 Tax=Steinernema carpocapsae TaxID=34508 RepID=A0A4U8UMR8_STECR|nr:hypothetical protein L596_001247 [Steinernema carpocapsae]
MSGSESPRRRCAAVLFAVTISVCETIRIDAVVEDVASINPWKRKAMNPPKIDQLCHEHSVTTDTLGAHPAP